jgi:sarcosine oxidase, subunit alpha
MSKARLSSHPILPVEKTYKKIYFYFNGKKLSAKADEMISSALFANGIHIFGYHKKDKAAQGMFCANGQCSQCLVIADCIPVKSCITPVKEGMEVFSLEGVPDISDKAPFISVKNNVSTIKTEVLIIGGGPAGLSAAIELGKKNVSCLVCDDKKDLGGKLCLQTHNFFGSIKECYAGSRGMDIGNILSSDLKKYSCITSWTDACVVGIFSDKAVGVLHNNRYVLVKPERIIVSTGAREKTVCFAGCDLPGIYGAGAFQTLVNRDYIKPTDKLFILGGGNVGLICAYHALQAGIEVVGLVEALPRCGGYNVHLNKIKRLGVPVFTSHTVVCAEGKNHLEHIVISEVDENFNPISGTEKVFAVDTLLIAAGLNSVNEFVLQSEKFGFNVYVAGDADCISEASAAMISGRIVARTLLQDKGVKISIPKKWVKMIEVFRSPPGPVKGLYDLPKDSLVYPVIRCDQEIPCNPCIDVCKYASISIPESTIMGRPRFEGKCVGCLRCVAICPGLAITLVDKRYDKTKHKAVVVLPWEMPQGVINENDEVITTGMHGKVIGKGKVLKIQELKWQNKRSHVFVEVPYNHADEVAGILIQKPSSGTSLSDGKKTCDDDVIVCRCERVTKKEIVDYIKKTGTRDVNAVKAALRVGMGPCNGKTCTPLIYQIFKELNISLKEVKPPVDRPFNQEVCLDCFVEEEQS